MHSIKSFYINEIFEDNEWKSNWVEEYTSGAVFVGNIGIKVGIGSVNK